MGAIFKKEMKSYFNSPVVYVMISLFILLMGIFFYLQNLKMLSPDFGYTLQVGEYFLIFFAPIITMRLLAEDKKNKTDILLYTSPTSVTKVILGKYFSAFTVLLIMVALTLIFPLIIMTLVDDISLMPWASLIGNYIGFVLLGALFLSVGLLASSLSDSQVLSAVVGIVSLFILWFVGSLGTSVGGVAGKILTFISPITRYEGFASGLLSVSDIVFYLTSTAVILFITIVNTERKRWSQG